MGFYSMSMDGCGMPCGFNACMEPAGLFEGVDREEKRALRRAERAGRAFRASKGCSGDGFLLRLVRRLRSNS